MRNDPMHQPSRQDQDTQQPEQPRSAASAAPAATATSAATATAAAPADGPLYFDDDGTVRSWLLRLLKGILVGIGAILPGLSGGVLAVIFGLYEPILDFFRNLTDRFKRRFLYLLPVGIGGAIGILIFAFFVSFAFQSYELIFVCLFIGFVLGTLPALWRTAGSQGRHTGDYVTLILCAIGIYYLLGLANTLHFTSPEDSFLTWFIAGAVIGLGVIVPGLSPSNFLIYFGMYDRMTDGIKALNFGIIVPLGLGGLACVILFSKLVGILIDHYHSKIYHAIFGLVIGSTLAIIPEIIVPGFAPAAIAQSGLGLPWTIVLSLLMVILGTWSSYAFSKLEARVGRE